jgi:DTW domain-containing protein YfiP
VSRWFLLGQHSRSHAYREYRLLLKFSNGDEEWPSAAKFPIRATDMKDSSIHIQPHRDMCYRCFKPLVTCLCDNITKVNNHTFVHIVQHMRERFHPIGTERIATLGLANVSLETVFPKDGRFCSEQVFPKGTALLYPSQNAAHIERLTDNERPLHLVVIDGTWYHASRIYRHSPNLQALPCLTFETRVPSNYRIRMEPDESANSTIEAVCRALKLLEPDTPGIDGLLACFDRMIDVQQHLAEQGTGRSVVRKQRHKPKLVPRFLTEGKKNLVIACGDAVQTESHSSKKGTLLTWNALRLSDRAAFRALVRPKGLLSEEETARLQYYGARYDGGLSVFEFQEAWRAFIKPKDVLITWNKQPMGRLFDMAGSHPEYFFLKAAYGTLRQRKCTYLDEVLRRENLEPTDMELPMFDERVARHLCAMDAILTLLRDFSANC